ncbi:MAG: hypothetical protein ACK5UT_15550, partial [Acidobacteriota bacterium]
MSARNPVLQSHIAEHPFLNPLVVAEHIRETSKTFPGYRVAADFSASSQWSAASSLSFIQGALRPHDFRQDILSSGCPDEGIGLCVVVVDRFVES